MRVVTEWKTVQEKLRGSKTVTVPNLTQEGEANSLRRSREPYVKELGKLAPYVSDKGRPERSGPQENGGCDCLLKTQDSAKSLKTTYRV